MSLVINHNLMAANATRNLNLSYGSLGVSTRRLSSGLRIGTAADDAAGLAIRELMRADIASMNQGIRNANDAVSMIQTADGALQIIDEKLIRMKELATQAATGTYNSDQRIIIDSEYQAMASEITRIAMATDFNGIHLLNGNLSGVHNGNGIHPTGALKVHFGTGNDSAEDYYSIQIGNSTAAWLGEGLGSGFDKETMITRAAESLRESFRNMYGQAGMDAIIPPPPATNTKIVDSNIEDFTLGLRTFLDDAQTNFLNDKYGGNVNAWRIDESAPERQRRELSWCDSALNWSAQNGIIPWSPADFTNDPTYMNPINTANPPNPPANRDLADPTWTSLDGTAEARKLLSDAKNGAGSFAGNTVYTQGDAQNALEAIDSAIVAKDHIRANLGAMQNRLENTITNLSIQSENLMASESRISDVDVASEMTEFVRQQILTQAATAMLAQANNLPKMAMQLIGG